MKERWGVCTCTFHRVEHRVAGRLAWQWVAVTTYIFRLRNHDHLYTYVRACTQPRPPYALAPPPSAGSSQNCRRCMCTTIRCGDALNLLIYGGGTHVRFCQWKATGVSRTVDEIILPFGMWAPPPHFPNRCTHLGPSHWKTKSLWTSFHSWWPFSTHEGAPGRGEEYPWVTSGGPLLLSSAKRRRMKRSLCSAPR